MIVQCLLNHLQSHCYCLVCPTLATPWTIAHQAPLSMGFPRQEYLSGLPFLSPESESESHSVTSDPLQPHGLYSPQNSPGQNTGMGNLSLLQRIFPTNPGIEPRSPALQADSLSAPKFIQFSSVAQWCPTLPPHEPQHVRPPCPSPTPGVHPNPCPSSQ